MRSLLLAIGALLLLAAPSQAAPGWSTSASLGAARNWHTATLLPDGTVLAAGGMNVAVVGAAERYDPARDAWLPAGTMVTPRTEHTATLLTNGKVLVAGGTIVVGGSINNAELYDPATNSWSAVQNMGAPRRDATATRLPGGKVLVTGGWNAAGTPVATTELFDPATNSWTPGPGMGAARALHAATTVAGGNVLLTGGYNTAAGAIVQSAEQYNAGSNSFVPKAAMGTKRAIHESTLLPDGRVLVSGGGDGLVHLGTAEVYSPAANSWAPTPAMLRAHNYHSATLLPNGKVLLAGGVNASGLVDRGAELYDPATNTWATAGNSSVLHSLHTATLLPSGQVLVVSGDNGNIRTPSVERWTPTTTLLSDPVVGFDDQVPGATTTGTAHITNTGDSPLLASRFALAGSNPGEFAIASDGCTGTPVAPGATCTVAVSFTPAAAGSRSATLTFEANTAAVTHAVSLLGRGIAPPVVPGPPLVVAAPPPAVVAPTQIVVTLAYVYSAGAKSTKIADLMVKGVPSGSTVTVTCKKGCAKKSLVKRNVSGTVKLTGLVTKRLSVGVAITVVVSKPGFSSAVKTLTIRKRKPPLVGTQCQPPGQAKPGRC